MKHNYEVHAEVIVIGPYILASLVNMTPSHIPSSLETEKK
jgi:hypothetical protein